MSQSVAGGAISGSFTVRAGERALVALAAAHEEPLVSPARREVEERLGRRFVPAS